MGREGSSVDWEKDIYARGKQLNLWPFSDVVSAFHAEMSDWGQSRLPKVLEVGCGAGNNLWALATLGYESFGVDISSTAISFGKKRFSQLDLNIDLREGTMSNLPFEDGFFDFVLDRAALTQVPMDEIPICLTEIRRVLGDQGRLYCFGLFGDQHSGRSLGQLQANRSYDNFSGGVFRKVGLTSFFNGHTIAKEFSMFSNVAVSRNSLELPTGEFREEYSLVAQGRSL